MNNVPAGLTCKNCGAPVTSEICPYCGCMTGVDTANANMDYPVLKCKEATLNFWTVAFPLIFAFGFGIIGAVLPILLAMSEQNEGKLPSVMVFCIPFAAIGIIAGYIGIRPVVRYIRIKTKGKCIKGTVCGYVNDNVTMNGSPAQVAKILIDTPVGKRVIMYQLGSIMKPYGVNTEVGLIVYKDMFLIDDKPEKINW